MFDTILESATRICDAKYGSFVLFEGAGYRGAAYDAPRLWSKGRAGYPVPLPLQGRPAWPRSSRSSP